MPLPPLSSIRETCKAQKARLGAKLDRLDDWADDAFANKGLYAYQALTAARTGLAKGARATGSFLHATGTALRDKTSDLALRTGLTEKLYAARTATADFVQDRVTARLSGLSTSFGTLGGTLTRKKAELAGKVNHFTGTLQQRWDAADARKAARAAAAAERLEARRQQQGQNNLWRNVAQISDQLKHLSEERPDFKFDAQPATLKGGVQAVVIRTNIPSRSQPVGEVAAITITSAGIMLEGVEKQDSATPSANSALGRITHLVTAVAPKRALTQAELEARMDPLELQARKAAAQRETRLRDPIQRELAAQEDFMVDHLTRLRAAVPGFRFAVKPFFDDRQGVERILIDTNLRAHGRQTKPSDTFKLILTKGGSRQDIVRIACFDNGRGEADLRSHTAINILSDVANLKMKPPEKDKQGTPVLRHVYALPRSTNQGNAVPA